jgi:hypothetical protein
MNAPAPQGNSIDYESTAVDVEDLDESTPVDAADSEEAAAVAGAAFYADPEAHADELGIPPDEQERAGRVIRRALRACPDLGERTPAREALWFTVQQEICTSGWKMVRPFGSTKPYLVTDEQASEELITAMTWLIAHEDRARSLSPLALFVMLRGVATRTGCGSARAAQSDLLHGVTGVPAGQRITWGSPEEIDAA